MPAVIGFAGFSGSGKTTLAVKVVAWLRASGLKIAVIKHDGHGHYKEAEGSDSAAYITAGADKVIVVSPGSTVTYEKRTGVTLEDQLRLLQDYELVIVEGFKDAKYAKIAVFRDEAQSAILKRVDGIVAIAADFPFDHRVWSVPLYSPDDIEAIGGFIGRFAGLGTNRAADDLGSFRQNENR